MAKYYPVAFLVQLLFSGIGVFAKLEVDLDDADSIKAAAALVAEDLMSFYNGEITGLLPGPILEGGYSWWTGGALWATMLDYRSLTGDTQYDDQISQGLQWQRGPDNDFLSPNWSSVAANDHQAVWAMAALLAAETGFTEPDEDEPNWLTLAKNVYHEQSDDARRVEDGICKGGLRWQVHHFSNGYNYVACSANVAYANIAARLNVLQDGRKKLAKAVDDTFQFLQDTKFLDDDFNVYHGASVPNCNPVSKIQLSHAAALALESAAMMYKSTGEDKWKQLVDGLTKRTIDVFFPDGVAKEVSCEPGKCDTDTTFFKAFLHRSLASTAMAVPHTVRLIVPALKSSAAAATQTCSGGLNGRICGFLWSDQSNTLTGAGPQTGVLSAMLSLLREYPDPGPDPDADNDSDSDSDSDSDADSDDTKDQPPTKSIYPVVPLMSGGPNTHLSVSATVFLASLALSVLFLGNSW